MHDHLIKEQLFNRIKNYFGLKNDSEIEFKQDEWDKSKKFYALKSSDENFKNFENFLINNIQDFNQYGYCYHCKIVDAGINEIRIQKELAEKIIDVVPEQTIEKLSGYFVNDAKKFFNNSKDILNLTSLDDILFSKKHQNSDYQGFEVKCNESDYLKFKNNFEVQKSQNKLLNNKYFQHEKENLIIDYIPEKQSLFISLQAVEFFNKATQEQKAEKVA